MQAAFVCCAAGFFYTGGPYPYGYYAMGEVFVFLFFGLVATALTYYAQALEAPRWIWWAGGAPGLHAVALLLVNNLRDSKQDRIVGKTTLAVLVGEPVTKALFALCVLSPSALPLLESFISLPAMAPGGWRPGGERLFPLLGTLVALPGLVVIRRFMQAKGEQLNAVLALTGKLSLLYAVLFVVGHATGA